jgi:hypothetical protein
VTTPQEPEDPPTETPGGSTIADPEVFEDPEHADDDVPTAPDDPTDKPASNGPLNPA